jgi:hypothetical protein
VAQASSATAPTTSSHSRRPASTAMATGHSRRACPAAKNSGLTTCRCRGPPSSGLTAWAGAGSPAGGGLGWLIDAQTASPVPALARMTRRSSSASSAAMPGTVASVPAEAVWMISRDSPTNRSTGPWVTSMCWTRK